MPKVLTFDELQEIEDLLTRVAVLYHDKPMALVCIVVGPDADRGTTMLSPELSRCEKCDAELRDALFEGVSNSVAKVLRSAGLVSDENEGRGVC